MTQANSVDAALAISEVTEVPEKGGWLWKYSVGKSFFSRKNWKMRYVKVTLDGITYFAQEPFDTPKGCVRWEDVTHVYNSVNADVDPEADDPRQFYFGLRFMLSPANEKLLLLRCDSAEERQSWTAHFNQMRSEYQRVQTLVDTDEEEDGKQKLRANRQNRPSLMEKLAVKLRGMVSLKKKRYQTDGFDLDLAYITPQLIAMGFPSEGREAVYRNPMDQVLQFFEKNHGGHFKVYNLCSERSYPPSRFGGSFARYPFDDHNPCPLEMLAPLCRDIQATLTAGLSPGAAANEDPSLGTIVSALEKLHAENGSTLPSEARELLSSREVVAVHCKAGKGRTGLVICAYLMYSRLCPTATAALKFFGDQRTKDGKGVQIPSQKRYLGYFETLLHDYADSLDYPPSAKVCLRTVILNTIPHFDPDGGCDPYLLVHRRKSGHQHVPCGTKEGCFKDQMEMIYDSREGHPVKHVSSKTPSFSIPLMRHFEGEVLFTLMDHDVGSRDDKMCSFWIHTGFLPNSGRFTLRKPEIDDAVKDKKHDMFDEQFSITLEYNFEGGAPAVRAPIAQKAPNSLAAGRVAPTPTGAINSISDTDIL